MCDQPGATLVSGRQLLRRLRRSNRFNLGWLAAGRRGITANRCAGIAAQPALEQLADKIPQRRLLRRAADLGDAASRRAGGGAIRWAAVFARFNATFVASRIAGARTAGINRYIPSLLDTNLHRHLHGDFLANLDRFLFADGERNFHECFAGNFLRHHAGLHDRFFAEHFLGGFAGHHLADLRRHDLGDRAGNHLRHFCRHLFGDDFWNHLGDGVRHLLGHGFGHHAGDTDRHHLSHLLFNLAANHDRHLLGDGASDDGGHRNLFGAGFVAGDLAGAEFIRLADEGVSAAEDAAVEQAVADQPAAAASGQQAAAAEQAAGSAAKQAAAAESATEPELATARGTRVAGITDRLAGVAGVAPGFAGIARGFAGRGATGFQARIARITEFHQFQAATHTVSFAGFDWNFLADGLYGGARFADGLRHWFHFGDADFFFDGFLTRFHDNFADRFAHREGAILVVGFRDLFAHGIGAFFHDDFGHRLHDGFGHFLVDALVDRFVDGAGDGFPDFDNRRLHDGFLNGVVDGSFFIAIVGAGDGPHDRFFHGAINGLIPSFGHGVVNDLLIWPECSEDCSEAPLMFADWLAAGGVFVGSAVSRVGGVGRPEDRRQNRRGQCPLNPHDAPPHRGE